MVRKANVTRLGVASCALLLTSSAVAQVTCYPNNPGMPSAGQTCYGNGSTQAPTAPAPTYQVPPGVHCNYLESVSGVCYVRSVRGWARYRQVRSQVIHMIAEGRCEEAVQLALTLEALELARAARETCRPAVAPQDAPPPG